jgi:CrcB protein
VEKLLMIVAGGGAGAVCRYVVSGWGQRLGPETFPLGTLIVNVLGCLLIGLLAQALTGAYLVREEIRIGLLVGFLGGFTTFSTYGMDALGLVNEGQFRLAGLYVVLSNCVGLFAVWFGYRLGERFIGV